MLLRDYLKQENYTMRHFAKCIGITHVTVFKMYHRITEPALTLALQIERFTDGQVRCEDLLKTDDYKANQKKKKHKDKDKKKRKKAAIA